MSRIGKKPVDLPGCFRLRVSGQTIEVKGPKGVRSFKATDDVTLESRRQRSVSVTPAWQIQARAPAVGHEPHNGRKLGHRRHGWFQERA